MDILVVAATAMEIAPFLGRQTGIEHLITGVGAPACMFQLQKKIYSKKYDFVLQAGIAGAFSDDVKAASCVVVEKDVFADIGVWENNHFSSLFELGFANKNDHPYHEGWIVNTHKVLQRSPLKKVNAITVNTVTDDERVNGANYQKYNASIESMEGAAFHYVCAMQQVSYLQIRSISNRVGDRDKSRWNIKDAVRQLNEELESHLNLLSQ